MDKQCKVIWHTFWINRQWLLYIKIYGIPAILGFAYLVNLGPNFFCKKHDWDTSSSLIYDRYQLHVVYHCKRQFGYLKPAQDRYVAGTHWSRTLVTLHCHHWWQTDMEWEHKYHVLKTLSHHGMVTLNQPFFPSQKIRLPHTIGYQTNTKVQGRSKTFQTFKSSDLKTPWDLNSKNNTVSRPYFFANDRFVLPTLNSELNSRSIFGASLKKIWADTLESITHSQSNV